MYYSRVNLSDATQIKMNYKFYVHLKLVAMNLISPLQKQSFLS